MIFPIVLSLPAMVFAIPPLMILAPATLSFGIQISTPIISSAAALAVVVDRFVQSCFGLFDGVLALLSFIGVHERRCHK